MNDNTNPYAPPESEVLITDGSEGVWRDGKQVVLARDAELPDRCIKCNLPTGGHRKKKRLYYYHPLMLVVIIVLLFVFFPVALLLAIILRKTAIIEFSLCQKHRRYYLMLSLMTFGLFISAILLPILAPPFMMSPGDLFMASIGIFAFALIPAAIHGHMIRSGRIDQDAIRIKGAGKAFLDSLPTFSPDKLG